MTLIAFSVKRSNMMVLITWCVPDREILAQRILSVVTNQTKGFSEVLCQLSDHKKSPGIKADQALNWEENVNFLNNKGSVLGSVGYIFLSHNLPSLMLQSGGGGDASRAQIFLK